MGWKTTERAAASGGAGQIDLFCGFPACTERLSYVMHSGVDDSLPTDLTDIARVHRALGDPVRLEILRLLPRHTRRVEDLMSVNELSEVMGLPQPTVSHHLKVLRECGVIRYLKQQNNVFYHLDVKRVREAYRDLCDAVFIKRKVKATGM